MLGRSGISGEGNGLRDYYVAKTLASTNFHKNGKTNGHRAEKYSQFELTKNTVGVIFIAVITHFGGILFNAQINVVL